MDAAGLWDDSGLVVIDGEMMPWSAKAQAMADLYRDIAPYRNGSRPIRMDSAACA